MNRPLQVANLIGVGLLSVLCVVQWRANRQAHLNATALEKANRQLTIELSQQRDASKKLKADLEEFREKVTIFSGDAHKTERRLTELEREAHTLRAERDQLKTSLASWTEAVAARDAKLKEAAELTQKLANERNETVLKFNELAEKHNALVNDLDTARRQLAAAATNSAR